MDNYNEMINELGYTPAIAETTAEEQAFLDETDNDPMTRVTYNLRQTLDLGATIEAGAPVLGDPYIRRFCWADRFVGGIAQARNLFDFNALNQLLSRLGYHITSEHINSFGRPVINYSHDERRSLTIIR